MDKILFITTRNILTTSGELRLIKNRSEAIYHKWGIKTDFIFIGNVNKIKNSNENINENIKGSKLYCFEINCFNFLFESIELCKKILEVIKNEKYNCVVLSGLYTSVLSLLLKRYCSDINLLTDIHGAYEDILFISENKKIFERIKYRMIYFTSKTIDKFFLKNIFGFIVVTNELGKYLKNILSIEGKKFYVVPCSTDSSTINYNKFEFNRRYYRRKYSIKDEELLFIYSGGASTWQCLEESFFLFKKIYKEKDIECKFLVISHQIDIIKSQMENTEGIIFDSYRPNDVCNVLSAGDYAFLLRKNHITNNVAFPNKFLEYVNCGLRIIATPHVHDVANFIRLYNLGFIYRNNYEDLVSYIKENKEIDWNSRNKVNELCSFNNCLKTLYEDNFAD